MKEIVFESASILDLGRLRVQIEDSPNVRNCFETRSSAILDMSASGRHLYGRFRILRPLQRDYRVSRAFHLYNTWRA